MKMEEKEGKKSKERNPKRGLGRILGKDWFDDRQLSLETSFGILTPSELG
jgi:hypothetical protein